MKIKSISVKDFKRFKDLTVSDLPKSAKLIVLIGPNGCGKSSLFDAIYGKMLMHSHGFDPSSGSYYDRRTGRSDTNLVMQGVNVCFYGSQPLDKTAWEKAVYVRSAYRNDPSFTVDRLSSVGSSLKEKRFYKMIDNDQATNLNYRRLVSQALEYIFEKGEDTKTLGDFREEMLADIRRGIQSLFPELTLNGLGDLLTGNATFRFNKGDVERFTYENLSGGEKAAFDLILDLVIKRREYNDTVFCIDEPEAHIGMRIQQKLLSALYQLVPDNSQLWIATHSIGMMREAYALQEKYPDKVVFLNFDDMDFDEPKVIKPAKMNRALWENMHKVVLGDLADLVMPETIYLCESTVEKSFDADCYNKIFSEKYPKIKFMSVGSKNDVKRICNLLVGAMPKLKIIPLRDRDNMAELELQEEKKKGVKVLSRTCVENYLLDDEVLSALCEKHKLPPETLGNLKEIRDTNQNNPKKASQDIKANILQINPSLQIGDNGEAFLKYSLAPLIKPSMKVYRDLEQDIFHNED